MRYASVAHKAYDRLSLFRAYRDSARDAAPGVDGETWRGWSTDAPARCLSLSRELASGAYAARPLRRVEAEKPDGGVRVLEVPCLRDKVAQLSVARMLAWCYREDFDRNGADLIFGPRRADPVGRAMGWSRRARVTLRADVSDFFGSVPRKRLFAEVGRRVTDARVFAWLAQWCRAVGLPQGLPVSPVLASIYLRKAFDGWAQAPERVGVVGVDRFADDVAVGFVSRAAAESFLAEASVRLAAYGLRFSARKTRLYERGETVPFLGVLRDGGGAVLAPSEASRVVEDEAGDVRLGRLRHYRRSGVTRQRLRGLMDGQAKPKGQAGRPPKCVACGDVTREGLRNEEGKTICPGCERQCAWCGCDARAGGLRDEGGARICAPCKGREGPTQAQWSGIVERERARLSKP